MQIAEGFEQKIIFRIVAAILARAWRLLLDYFVAGGDHSLPMTAQFLPKPFSTGMAFQIQIWISL